MLSYFHLIGVSDPYRNLMAPEGLLIDDHKLNQVRSFNGSTMPGVMSFLKQINIPPDIWNTSINLESLLSSIPIKKNHNPSYSGRIDSNIY